MAARNADSMTNAQGEFNPHKPRAEPMTTGGHQVGQKVSDADNVPEFHAQTLPAGSAPADRTFQPNATAEVPGQANNEDTLRSHGKESTYTNALDTLGGTDSAAVHTGLGHPGAGQSSAELRHDGKHHRKREGAGLEGVGAQGGSGLRDEGSATSRDLEADKSGKGPITGHNVSLDGVETREPEKAEQVASEVQQNS